MTIAGGKGLLQIIQSELGQKRFIKENGEILVRLLIGNISQSNFLLFYLILNSVSIKVAFLTLQSVQHGKMELWKKARLTALRI